ncbi:MAG: SMI1/KNR4 family protein [Candidatus Thiodiazotropha sp.]|jgi:hypothetical protein
MKINGFWLPYSFVSALKSNALSRTCGSWNLKTNSDAFGHYLETEIGEVWATEEKIRERTLNLPVSFKVDGCYGKQSEYFNEPGFIDDITDFSNIVEFAISGDGASFCFDYRSNISNPEVIWWDDVYWRKISNSYDEFISLFDTGS